MKPERILRVRANSVQSLPLERTNDVTWFSKTVCCDRYTLRGVPAKRVDVLLHPNYNIIEICKKKGKFDSQERDQIVLRPLQDTSGLRDADLYYSMTDETIQINIVSAWGKVHDILWTKTYNRLKSKLDEYNPESIILWHWRRYYSFLEYEIVKSVANEWVLTEWKSEWTLAEANRSASRMLYRVARQEGWRKYTEREKRKNGIPLDSPCWQRVG